ncbi:MAG: VOC family protein [Pseudomonadota bacterium]
MAKIDHLVFGASRLAEGEAWMTAQLGVPAAAHGRHALMSTHNALWRLDDCYLEVIAVDPDAPDPGRPRWYGLDDPAVRARLAEGPGLLTWVVEVDDLAAANGADHGSALRVTRDALSWQLTVPEDGRLRAEGTLPTLIVWDTGSPSPATTLEPSGCTLDQLVLSTDATRVSTVVERLALGPRVTVTSAGAAPLTAELTRADGTAIRLT